MVAEALSERDHRLLADHFGVSERGLGIRDLWGERPPKGLSTIKPLFGRH